MANREDASAGLGFLAGGFGRSLWIPFRDLGAWAAIDESSSIILPPDVSPADMMYAVAQLWALMRLRQRDAHRLFLEVELPRPDPTRARPSLPPTDYEVELYATTMDFAARRVFAALEHEGKSPTATLERAVAMMEQMKAPSDVFGLLAEEWGIRPPDAADIAARCSLGDNPGEAFDTLSPADQWWTEYSGSDEMPWIDTGLICPHEGASPTGAPYLLAVVPGRAPRQPGDNTRA